MHADATRVRQILINVLGNAAKFTHNGTIQLDVLRVEPADQAPQHGLAPATDRAAEAQIVCRVTDTGIGMKAEQLKQLFQPFVQLSSDTRFLYGGAGLGLALSHRLCQKMGGTIAVASALGQGSTFWVYLPTGVAVGSAGAPCYRAPAAETAQPQQLPA